MTSDASLPPPAPLPTSATLDDSQRYGYGEVNADQMSPAHPTLRETCADVYERVSRFLTARSESIHVQRTQEQSKIALEVIQKALKQYDFDSLSFSYNGGKDCLVLLILYLSALHTHFNSTKTSSATSNGLSDRPSTPDGFPTSIPSIYAKPPDPFPEVTAFVQTSTKAYHLSLTHISTNPGSNPKYKSHTSPPPSSAGQAGSKIELNGSVVPGSATQEAAHTQRETPIITFRDAFALYLDANPQIRAIFVGTRRTDPHGAKLTHFDMTDGNWPRFMRIHPVIDWQLGDVWTFLRHPALADPRSGKMLEYCSIYDMGYTSLGGVGDTVRNPRLKYWDENGDERYRPAYEMTEDVGERLGRE